MREAFWSSKTAPLLLLMTFAGACYFQSVLGRSDSGHVVYGILFALLLAILLVDRLLDASIDALTKRNPAGIPMLIGGLAVSGGLMWFCNATYRPLPALKAQLKWLETPSGFAEDKPGALPRLGKSEIPGEQEAMIRDVSEYIRGHTRPGEPVFDFSNQAGLLFFADRPTASRYLQVVCASLPEMQGEVVRDLERQQTSLVIFKTGSWFDNVDGVPAEQRSPVIARYLKARYEYAGQAGSVIFLKRRGGH
jgi:hypothetical protein